MSQVAEAWTPTQPRGSTALDTFTPYTYGRNSDLEFVAGKALVSDPQNQITPFGFFSDAVRIYGRGRFQ